MSDNGRKRIADAAVVYLLVLESRISNAQCAHDALFSVWSSSPGTEACFCNVKRANTEGCRLARIFSESLGELARCKIGSTLAPVPRVDPAKGVTLILRKLDVFLPFRRGALRMHRVDVREIPGESAGTR